MTKQILKINIAADFSREPVGRYITDGPSSGEAFRERVLWPALQKAPLIEINLDETEGYGSSFLEEAFGGLIRIHRFSLDDFTTRIRFISEEDSSLPEEIMIYAQEAHQQIKK